MFLECCTSAEGLEKIRALTRCAFNAPVVLTYHTKFDIDRQDAYYNDIVPFIMVYGTKEIAKSYVPSVRKAAEEKARSCDLTKPSLPLKVEVVRYNLTIG